MAAMQAPAINEDDIDKLTMPKAVKLCRENKISLEGTTDLDKIKWLLKFHLLSKKNEREKVCLCEWGVFFLLSVSYFFVTVEILMYLFRFQFSLLVFVLFTLTAAQRLHYSLLIYCTI